MSPGRRYLARRRKMTNRPNTNVLANVLESTRDINALLDREQLNGATRLFEVRGLSVRFRNFPFVHDLRLFR